MIEVAKPIWIDVVEDNQYVEAKQRFVVNSNNGVNIEICADAEYVVYINGNFVGTGQYRTYANRKVYDTYDISAFVNDGDNEIYIIAYYQGKETFQYAEGIPMLMFCIYQDNMPICSSNSSTSVRLHPYYLSGDDVEEITPQLGYTFYYNATKPQTDWKNATIVEGYTLNLCHRPIKKLEHKLLVKGQVINEGELIRKSNGTIAEMMYEDFLSKKTVTDTVCIKKSNTGVYLIYDLGTEYAGLLTFNIKAKPGTVVDIGYGEHLDDMRVRTSVGGRNFAFRYIVGDETNFTAYFRRIACRYIEVHITNMLDDVVIEDLGVIPTVYPIDNINLPICKDRLFKKICDVAVNTLRLCMHEHYEDCPWREQSLYALDSYIQMLCGYFAFGEYTFARESLRLLAESQMSNGLLELCAPSHFKMRTIPSFSLNWIMSLNEYVDYSGDVAFAKEVIGVAKNILDFFEIKNGLVQIHSDPYYWNFYEWTDGLHGEYTINWDSEAPIQFYYILACEAYNSLCTKLGIEEYDVDIHKLRSKAYETFYDDRRGVYLTRQNNLQLHELTQSLAYLAGVAEAESAVGNMVSGKLEMVKASLSTSLFKYEALLLQGGTYKNFVIDEIADIWGKMIYAGSDTFWETSTGAPAFGNAGSLCHGWSCVPLYLIFKYKLDV